MLNRDFEQNEVCEMFTLNVICIFQVIRVLNRIIFFLLQIDDCLNFNHLSLFFVKLGCFLNNIQQILNYGLMTFNLNH